MEQYIEKSALVAEIEKIRAKWFGINNDFADGQKGALTDVLSLIDTIKVKEIGVDFGDPKGDKSVKCIIETKTLEVKEVDLEKEIDFAMPSKYCWSGDGEAVYSKEQMRNFAKHFFELGLKMQKGE